MEFLDKLPGFTSILLLTIAATLGTMLILIATSYLKIVVVIHILKGALGLQEAPPSMVINALALILTAYIMSPIAIKSKQDFDQYGIDLNENMRHPKIFEAFKGSLSPIKHFLQKHTGENELNFFSNSMDRSMQNYQLKKIDKNNFIILIPAFATTQLKSAFQTGFMLYLPFIAIDLIVSNILLSLGMIMVSPVMISLPFKLLLFVMVDGWSRLMNALVLSFL